MAEGKGPGAREAVLARVREHLGVRGDEPGRRGLVASRLRNPEPNLIPERARRSGAERIKLFQAMLEKAGAKVQRLRSLKALPEAVADALRGANLPLRVRAGTDPAFQGLHADPGLIEVLEGPAGGTDSVGLSRAFAGAAETGTLFLVSGEENPTTLNFLPETHFVVIYAGDIAGSYEDCWKKVRESYGNRELPRTVNLISGPSRTADIEQTIVMGAHGPRNLAVFIVAD